MLRWLGRWRARRLERKRGLFSFFDSQRWRSVDPIAIHIAFETHPKFYWDIGVEVDAGDAEKTQVCCDAVCDVFGVKPWNENSGIGLTAAELLGLLDNYIWYIDGQKKSTSTGLISPQPTESESSPDPADQDSATAPSSDSTSTREDPICDKAVS